MNRFVPDWLTVLQHENKPALIVEDKTYSYADLYRLSRAFAERLQAYNVLQGDRVALLARNPLVFSVAMHAARFLKAILVPINTRLATSEMVWQVQDAAVSLFIADSNHEEQMLRVVHDTSRPIPTILLHEMQKDDAKSSFVQGSIDLELVQSIMYTSGTTGHPKGAMITYENHLFGAMMSGYRLGIAQGDCWLTSMPLFHVGGQAVLMRSVIYGTTAMIQERFDETEFNRAIDNGIVTLVSVVPAMLSRMLEGRITSYGSQLRCVLLGGGPAPRPLLERCAALHIPVSQSYGLTEANSQVATLPPSLSLEKLGSAGKPLSLNEIRIVDEDGHDVAPFSAGEIIVRGPTMTKGYYHNEEADRNAWKNGWFYTGDIGTVDEQGYLYMLDRRHDLIISGGENVYPAEIESVLSGHDAVQEAGVTGMANDRYGQVPIAFVVLQKDRMVTALELQTYCRSRLAGYKVPKEIRFVSSLPRNASLKLLRRELLQWV